MDCSVDVVSVPILAILQDRSDFITRIGKNQYLFEIFAKYFSVGTPIPLYPYKFPENTNKNNNLPTLNPYPYHHIVA